MKQLILNLRLHMPQLILILLLVLLLPHSAVHNHMKSVDIHAQFAKRKEDTCLVLKILLIILLVLMSVDIVT